MKILQEVIKRIYLSIRYGSIFTINRVIILFELIIVLVLGNIFVSIIVQDNSRKTEMRVLVENNIVMYEIDKDAQKEYCSNNGRSLGYFTSVHFYKREYGDIYRTHLHTEEYLNTVKLPLKKGRWFDEISMRELIKYDFVIIIPYEYRKDFKVGKVYNLYADADKESLYKVYVLGLLEPYIHSNHILGYDTKSLFLNENNIYSNLRYCQLDYFDVNELSELRIIRFDSDYQDMIESTRSDRGFIIVLIITLYTIFFCGFIGDRILNIDTYIKSYANMFLCGATKTKAMVTQFLQTLPNIILSILISFFIIKYIYIVQFKDLFFNVFAFAGLIILTLILNFMISLFILSIISKKSPVSIINGRYN